MKLTPPYYIVAFKRKDGSCTDDISAKDFLSRLSEKKLPGLLAIENNKAETYWQDLESIRYWKMNEQYLLGEDGVKEHFYGQYELEISKQE